MSVEDQDDRGGEILAFIRPSPARRVLATGSLGLLGAILVYIAASSPPSEPMWLVFLIVLGTGSLLLSWRLWQASATTLVLSREALFEQGGETICRLDNVALVDRGFFAFKPANGFRIRLKAPAARRVRPGLWWRMGRTVMVGGATSGGETKSMADLIKLLLAERDGA